MKIKIRESAECDIPLILSLYSQPDMDNGKIISVEQAKHIFYKMKSYPDYKIYVAADEERIVGTFALLIMDNLAHMGTPSAVIEDVVVSDSFQRMGVGKEMIRFAIDKGKEAKCYKVSLSSNINRKSAHAFYESLDFQKHGYSFVI